MAAIIIERIGREGNVSYDGPSAELPALIIQASSFDEAAGLAEATFPSTVTIRGFILPLRGYRVKEVSPSIWEFNAKYDRKESEEERQSESGGGEEPAFAFDTQGGEEHITQALEEVVIYSTTGVVLTPTMNGAIGVTSDGVEGADREKRGYNFSYTRYIPLALFTPAYRRRLRALSQKVNNAVWTAPSGDEFAKGEVRFRFAQGSQKGRNNAEVTFNFHAAEPVVNQTVGNIPNIYAEGQHLIWFRYRADDDDNTGIYTATHAYVDRVYEYGDFADLEP